MKAFLLEILLAIDGNRNVESTRDGLMHANVHACVWASLIRIHRSHPPMKFDYRRAALCAHHRIASGKRFFMVQTAKIVFPLAQIYYINRSNVSSTLVHFSTTIFSSFLSLYLLTILLFSHSSFHSHFYLLFLMIQVIRTDRSDRWTLQIKFPQLRDAGIYECQVNTEPKMSMAFRLNVVGEL